MTEGIVYSVLRDSYAVRTSDGIVNCSARGVFRKKGISPVTGDRVKLENSCITDILSRTAFLPRPPVANFDRMALVIAAAEPTPSEIIIDKLLAVAEAKGVEPIIIFNKSDLANIEPMKEIYEKAGFTAIVTDALTGFGIRELKKELDNRFTVFIGNSGVGKSSLLNRLIPSASLKTAEISKKLGRGRHTTRVCEIIELDSTTLIADTPGFAAVDIAEYEILYGDTLWQAFREFAPYTESCKFRSSCSHTGEKGCAVLNAVENGEISKSRFESYKTLYMQVKDNRPWNVKSVKK